MEPLAHSLCRSLYRICRRLEHSELLQNRAIRQEVLQLDPVYADLSRPNRFQEQWLTAQWRSKGSSPLDLWRLKTRAAICGDTHAALDEGMHAMQVGWQLVAAIDLAEKLTASQSLGLDQGAALIDEVARGSADASTAVRLDQLVSQVRASQESLPAVRGGHPLSELIFRTNKVMYSDWGFRGNREDYYEVSNNLIGDVMQRLTGLPISLAVVYATVLQRLGVTCAGTMYPSHFLLVARPQTQQDDASKTEIEQVARDADVERAAHVNEGNPSLEGDWLCKYGPHGPQLVRVFEHRDGVAAVKITGDEHIPAGELTWQSSTASLHELGCSTGKEFVGQIQLAEPGYQRPRFKPAKLKVWCGDNSSDTIQVEHAESNEPLIFSRLDPEAPLFIDAFNGGAVMSQKECLGLLKHRKDCNPMELEQYVAPVENLVVFVRMARNLQNCYSRDGDQELAAFWGRVALCLVTSRTLDISPVLDQSHI